MNACVYSDDEQVERLVVQKFEPDKVYPFRNSTPVLDAALDAEKPIVYVKVTDDVHEELV